MDSKEFTGAKDVVGNPIISQKSNLNRAVSRFIAPAWFYVVSAVSLVAWLSVLVFYLWKKLINNNNNKIKVT